MNEIIQINNKGKKQYPKTVFDAVMDKNGVTLTGGLMFINKMLENIKITEETGFYICDENGYYPFSLNDAGGISINDIDKINPVAISRILNYKVNLLIIGNSFSVDALAYLPAICKSLAVNITVGVMYIPGAPLSTHVDNWNSTGAYTYYEAHDGIWKDSGSLQIKNVLTKENWNVVVWHQESSKSGKYETISSDLDTLIKNTKESLPGASIGWLMTPAWGTFNSGFGSEYEDQDAMYNAIVEVGKKVISEKGLDFIIPECTAIQNARKTTLDQYGKDLFASAVDRHLEDGIGRLIAGYSVFIAILSNFLKKELSVEFLPEYDINVTTTNGSEYFVPQTSSFTKVTQEMADLGLKCAIAAHFKPYELTDNIE